MNKYIDPMIEQFESYIYMLDSVEPTNDTATFLSETVIYNNISKVIQQLPAFHCHSEQYLLYSSYLQLLFNIFYKVQSSSSKRDTMIIELNQSIHYLIQMNKEMSYAYH